MTKPVRFTIALPSYNNALTLPHALRSALSQDYPDEYEVLVVNNASTDNTLSVLEDFLQDKRLKIITNQETCSLYENHNVCLREATGDYVLFCHADDTLDPAALRVLHRSLEQRGFPRRIVMWGHSLYVDFYDELRNAGFRTGQIFAGTVAARTFFDIGLTPSGSCYCKSFLECGGFLPATFKAAPSDASSMVLAAVHGFRFEMIEEIIFFRLTASTATQGRPFAEIISAHQDAFSLLFSKIKRATAAKLLEQNSQRQRPSLLFYHSIFDLFPRAAWKGVAKEITRRPFLLRRKTVRSILYSMFRKRFAVARGSGK